MKLPEICVRHPVLAIVLNLIIVVVGIVGYSRLDIRFFPKIDIPVVSVSTHYQGASPNIIENSITTPIENALSGVEGVDSINSKSSNSSSSITIHFKRGRHFEQEVNSVRDKVSGVRAKLPTDADPSTITVGGNGQLLLSVGFTDPKKTTAQIRDYVRRNVWPRLRETNGVGWVGIYGASDYAMRIWLNAEKMALLGITVSDIETALKSNNIEFPAGVIHDLERNYSVISNTKLKTAKQFANIIIKKINGKFIRFKDVATVEIGNKSLQDSPMRINGKPGVDVQIKPLLSANPIDVAARVKTVLSAIQDTLPTGMSAQVNYDQSLFLKASIHETFKAVVEAVLLVILVVFLFLGSIRASTIAIVTIPLSIISLFGLLFFLGYTINVMTLLAIVLAIGLVVDDAIVMVENIHRHIELGVHPFKAAIKGSKQITLAVIAMTITLAAVYAPIGFAQGFTAVLFQEFAFTLAGAVIISGFVALTLSPMMCSMILKPSQNDSKWTKYSDDLFNRFALSYQKFLKVCLSRRALIISILVIIAGFGTIIYRFLPQEFVPQEDSGIIISSIISPTGSSINYTNRYMRKIEKIYQSVPEIGSYYNMVHAGSAASYVVLKPWGERKRSVQEVVKALAPRMDAIAGVNAFPTIPDPIDYGQSGSDLVLQLMTTGSYKDLIAPMDKLVTLASAYPGLEHVKKSMKFDNQEFSITINRNLAAELGVDIQSIADTAHVMLGGIHVTDFQGEGRSYPVMVRMDKDDLKNFVGFKKLYVRSRTGQMVSLMSLIKMTPVIGQASLHHFNRMRASSMTAQLAPGYTTGDAVKYLQKVMPQILTPQIHYAFDGKAAQFLASGSNLTSIVLLALVFIYLILSAQFGSFIDPFIILFSVPLCIVGALATLKLTGGTLNLYSEIGLVTLIGLVSKHGILITQFTNELRSGGMPIMDAVIEASKIRLRPILMTTSAMVFGALPLAFASGPGSVGREQIGWVIVGGLLLGTFFSLIVVPMAYSIFGVFKNRFRLGCDNKNSIVKAL